VLAFGATALAGVVTFGIKAQPMSVSGLALPVYLGALLSGAGLGLTVLAAPNLLRLRRPKDRATTEAGFHAFHRWGLLRAVCQIAAFPVNLWALRALARLP
jgi:hypothetical protein